MTRTPLRTLPRAAELADVPLTPPPPGRGRIRYVGVAEAVASFTAALPRLVWNMTALESGTMTLPEVHTLLGGVTVGGHLLDEERRVLDLAARCARCARGAETATGGGITVDAALARYARAVVAGEGGRRDLASAQIGLAADLLPTGHRVPLVPRSRRVELTHALATLDDGDAGELTGFLRDCTVL
ncbi:hypothetical protein [uncultured Corynebacterium sp.]|uniref:hypothetical protein n=1 Tax=uncultured Corynebacterium sp. TaxID=159447 RepID=UPI0025F58D15|nr:hypothetical protein [uncultured Corynebacterium sp.]